MRPARGSGVIVGVALLIGFAMAAGGAYVAGRNGVVPEAEPTPTPTEDPTDDIRQVARQFLRAWERENWDRLQALTIDQSLDAAGVHRQANEVLRITEARYYPDAPQVDGDSATVRFDATWEIDGLDTYRYTGALRLARSDEGNPPWKVRWWYPTVHPDLTPTGRFDRSRVFPVRAPILAQDGRPLVRSRDVVLVGLEPWRVARPRAVRRVLRQTTDADMQRVRRLLRRDDLDRDGFYAVAELSPPRFEALRPRLYPIQGLVFRREQQRQRPHGDLADSILGSLGEITAEQLENLGEPYRAGDRVGRSGIEAAFEEQLAGKPAREASLLDDLGLVRSFGFQRGENPEAVRLTLDIRMQRLAERALRQAPSPAALVAIDARNGAVRAAASTPSDGFNRALSGTYAPGSTFKVVTATAMLEQGWRPRRNVRCPAEIEVGNRPISNAGNAGYGQVTFQRSFAVSCNTTFARLGMHVGADAMTRQARQFGFGRDLELPIGVAGGAFPRPQSDPELARAAIGQANVEVSPLHMASVAATAATGEYRPPKLMAAEPSEVVHTLGDAAQQRLAQMMAAVVNNGTGTAARMPGQQVFGKTGSAQFDNTDRTHAWFIGYRGNLAFAVIVERGGGGGGVAAPVARDFLQRLDG
ncbi:MAG TPA: penicillin-binding transpeptidase domain-containing protein [Egibacteraceae bacterium]|nr:penicillin-binding transpeptidase domain-containing protein [Egibacteraceae bacterium]